MTVVYFNGDLRPAGEVCLPLDDAGFLRGEGLFETLRVEDGRPRRLDAHLDRMFTGLELLGLRIPESREHLAAGITELARTVCDGTARLRVTVTPGPERGPATRLATCEPWTPPPAAAYRDGVDVVIARSARVDSRSPLGSVKAVSYQLQRLAARSAAEVGAFEALMLNELAEIAEGSRSNVVVVRDGEPRTPGVASGCLPGVIRGALIACGAVVEARLLEEDLLAADGVLLTSALIGVMPVRSLDGRSIAVGSHAVDLCRALGDPWPGAR